MSVSGLPACFVDTNIWLYAFITTDDAAKSQQAGQLLKGLQPVVSTQVVNEVCVNLMKRGIFAEVQIRKLIESFYQKCQVWELTSVVLLKASDLRERYSLSFWDSTIVSASLYADVRVLYSEDMQHGMLIEDRLRIINPFSAPQ